MGLTSRAHVPRWLVALLSANVSAAAVGYLAKLMSPPTKKVEVRAFQLSWTEDFGSIFLKDRAVCTLCFENVVCRTSSVKCYFETKHERSFKENGDKAESIHLAVSRYGKHYRIAHCITKNGKPFTDGEYIMEAFLGCSEAPFKGLPNNKGHSHFSKKCSATH